MTRTEAIKALESVKAWDPRQHLVETLDSVIGYILEAVPADIVVDVEFEPAATEDVPVADVVDEPKRASKK